MIYQGDSQVECPVEERQGGNPSGAEERYVCRVGFIGSGERMRSCSPTVRAFTRSYRGKPDWPVRRKPAMLVRDATAEILARKLLDRNWRVCGRSRRPE